MGFIFEGLEQEAYDRKYSERYLIARIIRYFRAEWPAMLLITAAVLIGSCMNALLPFFIAQGMNELVRSFAMNKMAMIVAIIILSGVIAWGCNFVSQWCTARVVGDVVLHVRQDILQAVLHHDMSFFTKYASGSIVSRVTSDTEDFATVVTLSMSLFGQLLYMLILIGILLAINVKLSLIVLATTPVIILIAVGFRRFARHVYQRVQRVQSQVNSNIQESVSGIAIAKNFRQEQTMYNEFHAINTQSFRVGIQQGVLFGSIFPTLLTVVGISTAALVYFGGWDVIVGALTIGYWLLFVQSVNFFWMPLTNVSSFWSQFQQGLAASERIFALIDVESTLTTTQDVLPIPDRLAGKVEFRDVQFHYNDEHTVLSQLHLTIRAGETVALVGHTGAGKSTLLKLIARFYAFQAGQLLIDDRDIRALDLHAYRRQLGIVTQVPFLFSGTVADNIRYIQAHASDDEVASVARQIGEGTWLDALPDGLATVVEEGGKNLALGQRQLIALSRVLLQDPAIILLDEATASVDPLTEAQIEEGLAFVLAGRTAIIIAHRLSTVRHADRILVLSQGQIVEEGTHAALIRRKGYYGDLYNAYFRHQASDYEPGHGFVPTTHDVQS
ncbi:MAG TPA: ABC transporter ATP-binding protein [Ktedonobacteraceae bacterium]|nr:ABC transporter ATP-binding protein [Ktedonobacteraceae bacterium]